MDPTTLAAYLARLHTLPLSEQREILALVDKVNEARVREAARVDFMAFVKAMWPDFIEGRHHKIMASKFEAIANGQDGRTSISMAPRMTKSEFASYLFPAWFLGRCPNKKIIQVSHTSELAVGFGRKVRDLIADPKYQKIFPGIQLKSDNKAAGRWTTNKGGEYYAVGVGGAVAGKGADLLCVDDPIDEQTAIAGQTDPKIYDKLYEWYALARQRLQPGGSVVVVATRWHKRDLIGRLLSESSEKWEAIEFPAIMPSGEALWPEFWSLERLEAIKAEIPAYRWNAQYMQQPTGEEGALLKREWWRTWTKEDPPSCEFLITSWDTAFSKSERADFSACTTWGVWMAPSEDGGTIPSLILLDAFKGRYEFPELKQVAFQHWKEWQPDALIVEGKASGMPLVFEMRQSGIPVQEFVPTRATGDKLARVNAISDIFASGAVWAPDTRWADEVKEECADFPAGAHDDYVDTVVMALQKFRNGGFIRLRTDDYDDEPVYRPKVAYY